MKPAGLQTNVASLQWATDAPVVQGRTVNGPVPIFGDDVWDLRCIVFRNNAPASDSRCDFSSIADPLRRLTAKELIMQRLNRLLPTSRRSRRPKLISAGSASSLLEHIRRVYDFMDQRTIHRLADLTQDDLNSFQRLLSGAKTTPKHQAYVLTIFYALYESRDWLSYDAVTFLPWNGKSLLDLVGYERPEENLTERIPEPIMGPLLRWALAYIDHFAPDIISAQQEFASVTQESTKRRPHPGKGEARRRLQEWLDLQRQDRRPLPAFPRQGRLTLSWSLVAAATGITMASVKTNRDIIDDAARELGLAVGGLGASPAVPPSASSPWHVPFDMHSIKVECRHLITACYIVCAYLSGMRDSEVQDLRVGCCRPVRDAQGAVIRHHLHGTTFKGSDLSGEKRQWVVIEPVARAISVLEELTTDFRRETGSDLLFVNLHNRKTDFAIKSRAARRVNDFRDHINATLQPRLIDMGIPANPAGPDGEPWLFNTRQFRRTVAWHIANRPFGVVAGMIQYGHTCEVIFEGYAGNSASGFRAEVEAERALARQSDIVEMYEDHKRGVRVAGPMADQIGAEFDDIRATLGDFPGKVVDEARRDKMLHHFRVRLFPGLLADCFFTPEEARCLRHLRTAERREPVAGICDPHCANACWAKKHLPVWKHTLDDTLQLSRRNRISPIQHDILKAKADECRAVVNAITEAANVR